MTDRDPDRYLMCRGGRWFYKRRVPARFADLDDRGTIRKALRTTDVRRARIQRDELEAADEAFWSSLVRDGRDPALARYDAAVRRAVAYDLAYAPAAVLAREASLEDLVGRAELLPQGRRAARREVDAVLGGVDPPRLTVSKAFERFLDEIAPAQLAGKSENQRRKWIANKRRAVMRFAAVVGDRVIDEISREDALKFFRFWSDRVSGAAGGRAYSSSSAKREIDTMRKLWADWFAWLGAAPGDNPFRNLSFRKTAAAPVPPFPVAWLAQQVLAPGRLDGLNTQARLIVLAMIETGCRPSELANIAADAVRLEANVPHLVVRAVTGRDIKTRSSARRIPLVGVSLEAMRCAPAGFPRYRDREDTLSNTLNKFFRENGLFPTEAYRIYSIRHAFEERMKEGGLDFELRCRLMGHAVERPQYGSGGSMEYQAGELARIALDFDPSIVPRAPRSAT